MSILNFFKFIKRLRNENYEIALSARPDTRDYILLLLINPKSFIL